MLHTVRRPGVGLALVLSILLAACAPGGQSGQTGQTGQTGAPTTAPATGASGEQPRSGGTLT